MNIAFFTETEYTGKIPRNNSNMRTDTAWICALNADHYNIHNQEIPNKYDLGICIIPKNNPQAIKDYYEKQGKISDQTMIDAGRGDEVIKRKKR